MKKALPIILALCRITASVSAQFKGSGTETAPFLISNIAELAELARKVNSGTDYEGKYFTLTTNLDLSGWDSGDGYGWKPIGLNETLSFKGRFNGNEKVISGLTINRYDQENIGLFGYISGAVIKYLGMVNVDIVGKGSVGGLVGSAAKNSNLSHCYVTGTISLVGQNTYNVGGLVGSSSEGTQISHCYSSGLVTGCDAVGGLVGGMYDSNVMNCYSSGIIRGKGDWVGGLVGINSQGLITNSIAANPSVSGTGSNVHRVVGYHVSDKPSDNNYALATMDILSNKTSSYVTADGLDKSLAELKSEGFYTNPANWDKPWDIQSIHNDAKTWNLWKGNSLPYFQWQSAPVGIISTIYENVSGIYRTDDGQKTDSIVFFLNGSYHSRISSPTGGKWSFNGVVSEEDALAVVVYESGQAITAVDFQGKDFISGFGGGSGMATDPYQIKNVNHLTELAEKVNNGTTFNGIHFILTDNLDISNWDSGDNLGWRPIGTYYFPTPYCFKGIFDGNNKVISGLTINRPQEDNLGLFRYTDGAKIKNLGLTNVNILGRHSIGCLVAVSRNDLIDSCYVSGVVRGMGPAGGLLGTTHKSIVTHSYASVDIKGGSPVGGLIAENGGTVQNCYATGNVYELSSSFSFVGGLVGFNKGTISDSYALSNVSGKEYVGGLVGRNHESITNSYATGDVRGENTGIGGLIGWQIYGEINNCYASGQVTGKSSVGGLVGIVMEGRIHNSVAANPRIDGISDVNRIVGESGITDKNYANAEMLVNNEKVRDGELHGVGKSVSQLQSIDFYTNSDNWVEGKVWDMEKSHTTSAIWNLWEGKSFPYFQWQAAPPVFTGTPGNINGIYRTDDGQTTDSLAFYVNGVYHSRIIPSGDGRWSFRGTVSQNDTLTIVVYEAGKTISAVDITGDILVSNEAVIDLNKIWVENGHVCMCVERATPVQIYNVSGTLVNSRSLAAGGIYRVQLPVGIYVVRAGKESYKVMIK